MSKRTNSIFYLRFSVLKSAAICLTPLFLMCSSAFAQSPAYQVDHWTTDNGLPQNTVTNIIQTRDGYLWLATFDGLARFDGVRFTVFNKSNTPGINSSRFFSTGVKVTQSLE